MLVVSVKIADEVQLIYRVRPTDQWKIVQPSQEPRYTNQC